jgi:acetyl-CoA acetyltransferase
MPRPRDVAIVGVYSTKQERLSQRSTVSISLEAIHGALADAGLAPGDVDAYFGLTFPLGNGMGPSDGNVARQLGHALHIVNPMSGAMALLQAAAAIRDGLCEVAILASGSSRAASEGGVVDWTRPDYEFTEWTGSITPAQMALQMRRHMHEFGTTAEQLAHACATVRNHGHINPDAVMFKRGPYTAEDVLEARMIADPFTLLMCSIVNDGGNCVVVTSAERARDCRTPPVWVLSGAMESRYTAYYEAPTLELLEGRPQMLEGFERAGVRHDDVDLVMVYDHFASGIVMQYEALGFCEVGAGGPFVMENIGLDDPFPICPDGGNLAFSHPGNPYNFKIIEAVKQFRGDVRDLCPNGDRGLHTYDRSVCRKLRDPKIAVACGPMTGRHSFAVLARD